VNGKCCSCGEFTIPVLDLGSQRTPDFPEPGTPLPAAYPLQLMLCPRCTLLQLDEAVDRSVLYHPRYGFKSGINEAIRYDLADVVRYSFDQKPDAASWLDIASNDGTLLSNVPEHIERVGIDPMVQFAREALTHANWIIPDFFSPDCFTPGSFDIITSVSMFYDLADPGEFVQGVREVLDTHGIWVIQQNYALDMLRLNAVDNICHEHITYFSVKSLWFLLNRHGMEINDVQHSDVNGGCFRVTVSHKGRRPVKESVWQALAEEEAAHLYEDRTFHQWGRAVLAQLDRTKKLLARASAQGERVQVYGASTRGGTILQLIGADPGTLEAAVERSPAKVGKIMAAAGGLPIISEEEMRADPPDYLLVSPWFFREVFIEREREYLARGGRMVFPLPHFEVFADFTMSIGRMR
jgi:NDP-4-keto-2,6-dideoxyhexose 3-C-methyltransferase